MQQLGLHLLTPDPYAGKHPRIISFAANQAGSIVLMA
jgi:hypothetical protein